VDARELHKALRVVARVLADGEATHRVGSANHWTRLSPREHTRRAMVHGERFILGVLVDHDDTDELAHAQRDCCWRSSCGNGSSVNNWTGRTISN
jgi:hypothetical protein